jgi:hypothetical protein
MNGSRSDFLEALGVLAALVHEEYPPDLTLVEIAELWGLDVAPNQLRALKTVEPLLSRT